MFSQNIFKVLADKQRRDSIHTSWKFYAKGEEKNAVGVRTAWSMYKDSCFKYVNEVKSHL